MFHDFLPFHSGALRFKRNSLNRKCPCTRDAWSWSQIYATFPTNTWRRFVWILRKRVSAIPFFSDSSHSHLKTDRMNVVRSIHCILLLNAHSMPVLSGLSTNKLTIISTTDLSSCFYLQFGLIPTTIILCRLLSRCISLHHGPTWLLTLTQQWGGTSPESMHCYIWTHNIAMLQSLHLSNVAAHVHNNMQGFQ